MKLPNSPERQVMQHLRGAGWVKARGLQGDSPRIIANLIAKGWVECQQRESGRAYRLTESGLQAMKVPLPIHRDRAEEKMKQVDAMREILAEWRALPKAQRQTEEDATRFAMEIKDKYKFRSGTADPYQTIRAWLLRDMSLTRGLPD